MHKIASSIDEIIFNKESIATIDCDGIAVCVAQKNEQLYAFPAACPHAGASLAKAYIDSRGHVVCPLHFYKFSLKTGLPINNDSCRLKLFEVVVNDGGVFINM